MRPLRPHEDIPVPITPVPGVRSKETRSNAQRRHPRHLVFPGHLPVDKNHARVFARVGRLRRLKGVQDVFNGRIAVTVNSELIARFVQCRDLFKQLHPGQLRGNRGNPRHRDTA